MRKAFERDFMRSFRKRLLVLIIGLVIVTQTVTLAAVLASTRRAVEARAAEQLRSGRLAGRATSSASAPAQLANGVAVLAADFGFREAVASGHAPTILSAARNNAQRIGADLVLVLDTRGQVLASTAPAVRADGGGSLEQPAAGGPSAREQPTFHIFGAHVLPGVPGPGAHPGDHRLGADGLRRRRALAQQHPRRWSAREVQIVTHGTTASRVQSPRPCRRAQRHARAVPSPHGRATAPHLVRLAGIDYLSFVRRLDGRGDSVDVILLEAAGEVLRALPRAARRDAADRRRRAAAWPRSSARCSAAAPRGRSASWCAPRSASRRASTRPPSSVSGGEEFRSLAGTFNAMQQQHRRARGGHHLPRLARPADAAAQPRVRPARDRAPGPRGRGRPRASR